MKNENVGNENGKKLKCCSEKYKKNEKDARAMFDLIEAVPDSAQPYISLL